MAEEYGLAFCYFLLSSLMVYFAIQIGKIVQVATNKEPKQLLIKIHSFNLFGLVVLQVISLIIWSWLRSCDKDPQEMTEECQKRFFYKLTLEIVYTVFHGYVETFLLSLLVKFTNSESKELGESNTMPSILYVHNQQIALPSF